MYLCCVEILSGFRSKLDFLRIFKVTQKSGQRHCTIVQGIRQKMATKEFFIFIIFPDAYAFLYFFSDAYTCSYVVFKV